jgi:hypothetical protein
MINATFSELDDIFRISYNGPMIKFYLKFFSTNATRAKSVSLHDIIFKYGYYYGPDWLRNMPQFKYTVSLETLFTDFEFFSFILQDSIFINNSFFWDLTFEITEGRIYRALKESSTEGLEDFIYYTMGGISSQEIEKLLFDYLTNKYSTLVEPVSSPETACFVLKQMPRTKCAKALYQIMDVCMSQSKAGPFNLE